MPLIDNPHGGRRIQEWIADHPDQKVPDKIKDRVFVRHGGICHLSKMKIRPGQEWHMEHIKPLALGGQHRENNLAPALAEPHKTKTAQEAGVISKADRVRRKLVTGTWPGSRAKIKSRGFQKSRDV